MPPCKSLDLFPWIDDVNRIRERVLEDIYGVPPLRPKTRATVSAFTYRRGLTISLRCDPYRFRLEDTRGLLKLYADRLRHFGGIT